MGFTFNFNDKSKSELTSGTPEVITLPVSYDKTRSVFNHYAPSPLPNQDSIHYENGDTISKTFYAFPLIREMGQVTNPENYESKTRSLIRLISGHPVLNIEPYSETFQLGKQNQNSPKFENTGFKKPSAYSPKTENLGYGTSITINKSGANSNLKNLHDGSYLKDYYNRGFKKGDVLNYRNDDIFGFDQPFILKEIGDKWGINGMSNVDAGIIRGGLNTAIARTISDELRIAKFILTPKGIIFGLKQSAFQMFNTKVETRVWNPLSIFGSVVPTVHINRHWGPLGASLSNDFIAIKNDPQKWASDKLKDIGTDIITNNRDTSLQSHFNKEHKIIQYSNLSLESKLGQLQGIGREKSREIDANKLQALNSRSRPDPFREIDAVKHAGDQGASGIITQTAFFGQDPTKLGFYMADVGQFNDGFVTSKVDRVNAIPYGNMDELEPGSVDGKGLGVVKDFIPFKFKDVVNNK